VPNFLLFCGIAQFCSVAGPLEAESVIRGRDEAEDGFLIDPQAKVRSVTSKL